MENLQLIMVTVLITLISGALVGSLIYLGVVVRKLRRTVKDNVVDIINLQNALNAEIKIVYDTINNVQNDLETNYSELDRKIDSRYDKLQDNLLKDIEHLRNLSRESLGLIKQTK